MTVEWDDKEAKGFGDRHEDYRGNLKRARQVDLHNNRIGRAYGRREDGKCNSRVLVFADCKAQADKPDGGPLIFGGGDRPGSY